MAAALSLQEDILALVKKHGDTCLPEDLLARLAEEARLLAVREQIRSLHEADRFGLFSEPSGQEEETNADEDDGDAGEDGDAEQQGGSSGAGKDSNGQTLVLPDNVQHMLSNMKITRLDKVAALNGFTTIDAEVEFSQGNASTSSTSPSHPSPHGSAAPHAAGEAAGGGSGPPLSPEKKPPVYLFFRFRRQPLPKNTDASASGSDSSDSESGSGSDDGNDVFLTNVVGTRTSSVTVVNLSDEEEEAEGDSAKAAAAVVAQAKGRRKGGNHSTPTPKSGRDGGGDGGRQVGGGAKDGGLQRRKRASSRGGESDTGNDGDKRRKRPKGTEGGEEEKEKETQEGEGGAGCAEEVCQTGCCPDEQLRFEPRTLASYTVSGGMGFEKPNVLLQAVVYARGDGPACVMPPPTGLGPHAGEEEVMLASDTSDQEDVFDCNVDGPALAAVGRALGLHTDPVAPDSDSDSDEQEKEQQDGRSSQQLEGHGEGGAKNGGMTLSDLVWWVMLFPFFEKEFDMVEVVASSVFGDDASDSDDGEGQDDGDSGDSDDGEPGN